MWQSIQVQIILCGSVYMCGEGAHTRGEEDLLLSLNPKLAVSQPVSYCSPPVSVLSVGLIFQG